MDEELVKFDVEVPLVRTVSNPPVPVEEAPVVTAVAFAIAGTR